MACHVGSSILKWRLSITENESSEKSCLSPATSRIHSCVCEPNINGLTLKVGMKSSPFAQNCFLGRRAEWKIAFALNTGGVSGNGDQQSINEGSSNLGGTRLGRILTAGGRQLLEKLNSTRKNLPLKIFLLLLGFYTANALATILGQTGDWDVLVAGVVVAAIEGIGMLIYRMPATARPGRLQSFLVMVNFWKAGICLGLFVDAFKLGS
ncbi:ycf20-like protein [Vigna radiata var. radiata]|uniref:Ycf20-like protein n=1 Tax=Vigna radiata var. radiata TaxID=3916 RepID=A0A1S3URR5_VIGRR|nr:ycf20-like protein [Vigna radiata var. radiata]XP_022639212.1 ycf20-like protein [Vigna radiata var. radiata]